MRERSNFLGLGRIDLQRATLCARKGEHNTKKKTKHTQTEMVQNIHHGPLGTKTLHTTRLSCLLHTHTQNGYARVYVRIAKGSASPRRSLPNWHRLTNWFYSHRARNPARRDQAQRHTHTQHTPFRRTAKRCTRGSDAHAQRLRFYLQQLQQQQNALRVCCSSADPVRGRAVMRVNNAFAMREIFEWCG